MKTRNSGLVIMLICTVIFMCIAVIYSNNRKNAEIKLEESGGETIVVDSGADLIIWYNDSSLVPYIEESAYRYSSGLNIDLVQVSTLDYLEKINEFNLEGKGMPDIYIVDSEMLQKAYMAGLTSTNEDPAYSEQNYSKTALAAASCDGGLVAYPFYFDTAYMVYNKAYAANAPKTFDEILNFASSFDAAATGTVENILRWDAKSLLYNYGFIGSYINLGGENGDDQTIVDLNNENLIASLNYYQALSQYFSIDINTVSSDSVLQEFTQGRTVYSILGVSALSALNESGINYGIAVYPDLTETLKSRSLSATTVAVVNPYSKHLEKAQKFVNYITYEHAGDLYGQTGLMASRKFESYEIPGMEMIMKQYAQSASLPKLISASDFWVQLQNMLNNVWKGMDTATEAGTMESRMLSRLNLNNQQ
ncbi:sugar ABC transporter substrate-binding protein [Parasporobacterium paucivorans]|uniref:Maltose-binding protein MalE n=1 Tax=Parasporobacterium paucivorans DSM 15970 TaxID=1122934 RepID=A0A1M6G897_9FIRM|nr:extracellular solute-binding protein [Parasporobacterium paucivorans]SHJ06142.1 Maltose-binding protein MalE [Parasporobacterium paucivorans DSM 15970]